MKNAVTLALAAILSTASLGSVSYAQTTNSTSTATMTDEIRIVRITENSDSDDATTQVPQMYLNPTAELTAEARAEAQADPAIAAELEKNSITLENVQAIETAANGGKIIYVK